MSFIQPAFIRKNTPELREKLKQLGHQICSCCNSESGWLFTSHSDDVHAVHEVEKAEFLADVNERQDMIDCGDNEEMFLALAALRDDSCYMQWFVRNDKWDLWRHAGHPHEVWTNRGLGAIFIKGHKATPEELIEHFKEKADED